MKKASNIKQGTVEAVTSEEVEFTNDSTDESVKRSIGFALTTMRQKKSLSIEQVAANLNISERYISAIENMSKADLPERVYTLGFVRSYARYLGVDPQKSVDQFKREIYDGLISQNFNMPEPLMPIEKPKTPLVIATLVMGIATWFAFEYFTGTSFNNTPVTEAPTTDPAKAIESKPLENSINNRPIAYGPETQAAPVAQEHAAVANEPLAQTTSTKDTPPLSLKVSDAAFEESTTPSAPTPLKLNQVTFQFDQKTWMEIKKGAQVLISKNFQAGESYSFPISNDISISTQDTKAFKVVFNGQSISFDSYGTQLTNFNLKPDKLAPALNSQEAPEGEPKVQ